MIDFNQIDEARRLLGLGESASMQEIKDTYRTLAMKYHPDKCKEEEKSSCEEMFKKINNAYKIIMAYCSSYRYSFRREDVRENVMDAEFYEHLRRFYGEDGQIWVYE